MEVEIDRIVISPNRQGLGMKAVEKLAENIKELGFIHPIVVNIEYSLIAEMHRLKAVQLLRCEKIKSARCGLDFVPAKSFTKDSAEKLGISQSSVERRVRIGDRVTSAAIAAFDNAEEKISQREALKLTHIPHEHQEEAARQHVAGKDYRLGYPGMADCGAPEQTDIYLAQTDQPAATTVQDMADGEKRKADRLLLFPVLRYKRVQ